MNLSILFRGCVLAILVGALFKINHWQGADWLLMLGLAASLVLVVAALVEIVKSQRISGREKVLWMTAVLFGNAIGLLLYLFIGRRRVLTGR